MSWVFKDMDEILKHVFQENENANKFTSKMRRNYLSLYDEDIPDTLKKKRITVKNHIT